MDRWMDRSEGREGRWEEQIDRFGRQWLVSARNLTPTKKLLYKETAIRERLIAIT